jgi:fatty-acyl-CoA synthase
MFAGGVASPINTRLKRTEIQEYSDSIGLTTVVADERYAHLIRECSLGAIEIPGEAGARMESQLGELGATRQGWYEPLSENDPAVIFPTGGTTGIPKGAFTDQRGLATWTWNVALSGRRAPQDVDLFFSPCFHVTFVVGVLTPLFAGNTVVVQDSFSPPRAIEAIGRWKVNRLMGAPTMLRALMDQAEKDGIDSFDTVQHVLFGGAATLPGLIGRMARMFPKAALMTGLGATELASAVTRIENSDLRSGNYRGVGRVLAGARLKILDDDGQEIPIGGVGEIAVRSPWQTLGYWNREKETSTAYMEDGFVRLGDLGFLDSSDWLTVTGRSKEMIRSGGENVFPREIESVIREVPAVEEVVVFGVNDDHWG